MYALTTRNLKRASSTLQMKFLISFVDISYISFRYQIAGKGDVSLGGVWRGNRVVAVGKGNREGMDWW